MLEYLPEWARGPVESLAKTLGGKQDDIIADVFVLVFWAVVVGIVLGVWRILRFVLRRLFRPRPPSVPLAILSPPPDFTGRVKDMKAIVRAMKPGKVTAITAVAGMGGVGKTATARKVAHDLHAKGRFRDGGREVNLGGYDRPMDAVAALRALMPGAEGDLARLQARWREETAGKDMLILFDNLRDEAVLAEIMPGAGPTVLVTTREEKFAGAVPLDELTAQEAQALIATLAPRVPKGTRAEIAGTGFHLPLVIEVIAREVERLDTLTVEEALAPFRTPQYLGRTPTNRDETIIAIFGHSIAALPEGERMEYAALSLFAGGFFEKVAADLWEMTPEAARRRLADWRARGLVLPADDGPLIGTRWRLHDLLAEAGRVHLDAGDGAALRRRWVAAMLKVLATADEQYCSDDPLPGLALFDLERESIEAAQARAVAHWEAEQAAGSDALARAAMRFPNHPLLGTRLAWNEYLAWLDAALPAARALGEVEDEAMVLGNIGGVAQMAGEFDRARTALEESIALKRRRGDRLGEAQSEGSLGNLFKDQPIPDLDAAHAAYGRSLALSITFHDAPEPGLARRAKQTSATTQGNLGIIFRLRGDFDEAIAAYRRNLSIRTEIGDLHGAANDWFNLSIVLAKTGAKAAARRAAETARDHYRALTMPEKVAETEAQLAHIDALP